MPFPNHTILPEWGIKNARILTCKMSNESPWPSASSNLLVEFVCHILPGWYCLDDITLCSHTLYCIISIPFDCAPLPLNWDETWFSKPEYIPNMRMNCNIGNCGMHYQFWQSWLEIVISIDYPQMSFPTHISLSGWGTEHAWNLTYKILNMRI